MCQNLIIGNKRGYWNSQLIHEDLHCSSIEDGGKIINKILSNKKMLIIITYLDKIKF